MLPLIAALRGRAPGLHCLVTTGTVAAARVVAERLPDGCIHQYAPVDTAGVVRCFLDHWRPDLALWVESEFWPRLMVETARRSVPMMLLNARISERSARRWDHVPGMAAALVRLFAAIAAQDAPSAARLAAMGADPARVAVTGNLKAKIDPPACDPDALAALRARLEGRPVWLAVSTHAPEELAVAEAHRAAGLPGLLTILAPRHPERGGEIAALLAGQRLAVARRTQGGLPGPGTDVWIADTLGEAGLWFRLAPVSFVGGSLAPRGGHNPFEAAALGSAILHGPSTGNFAPAYTALDAAGGAERVNDGRALGNAVARLIGDWTARGAMSAAAERVRLAEAPDVDALASRALALIKGGT